MCPALCDISAPLRRLSAEPLDSNSTNFTYSLVLPKRACRRDPCPFRATRRIQSPFLPAVYVAQSDPAELAHCDYLCALHDVTNLYRYGPFELLRLSCRHRTLPSTVSRRCKTTSTFTFISA